MVSYIGPRKAHKRPYGPHGPSWALGLESPSTCMLVIAQQYDEEELLVQVLDHRDESVAAQVSYDFALCVGRFFNGE